MKIVLIILGILFALALFGLLFPAIIAAVIAWFLFSSGHIGWGIVCCIVGLMSEIGYLVGVLSGNISGPGEYDEDGGGSGLSWPEAFTAFYFIDHMRNKDD